MRETSNFEPRTSNRSWRRTLWIVWFAELTSIIGFTVVIPILPLYVRELGVTDPDAATFWSGVVFSAHAVAMAVMAPIWGTLADRYGRKLMVERAMFAGAVLIGMMGFARSVQQLALLRALQGMLTGTVTAATTLVASTAPRERSGYALGILQMGIYTGAAVGPVVGGVITDTLGFRAAFLTTAGLLFTGGTLVALFVREDFQPVEGPSRRGWAALRESLGPVLRQRPLLSAFGVRLTMRMAGRLLGPILPYFVEQLAPLAPTATLTGVVRMANAAGGAVGALTLGRLADRIGRRRVLLACALALVGLYTLQFLVRDVVQLAALQAVTGLAMGGVLAALSATLASLAPEGHHGAVYGLDATVVSGANAVAPMIGTAISVAFGYRATFLGAAFLFSIALAVASALLPGEGREARRRRD